MESADLDTQLADIPTVAEMNARTLVSSGYATPTNITAASGVSLAATGLDAIADPDDLTVGTVPTTFTQKLRWLIQRFWKGTKTATALTVKNEAGSVITTQSVSDDGTTESLNGPA
jgi:hypothetical protein